MEKNELSKNASGGTEQMLERIYRDLPKDLLDKFQIIPSRVRNLEDKIRILYCHDLPEDPENKHLENNGWENFNKIVFVSHWQRDMFMIRYNIPISRTAVILNSVEPFENKWETKPKDVVNIIYHTTPHRGLELLVPVFELLEKTTKNIHLDVFSSFDIYGWPERNKPYEPLFERIKSSKNMTYHGFKPNKEVREYLTKAHIFAYPSIWPETSCIALIEAMASGCICIHPNFAALPETAANWTYMYNMHEDSNLHANILYNILNATIQEVKHLQESNYDLELMSMKYAAQSYANIHYNWNIKKNQWISLLNSMSGELPIEKKKEMFSIDTGNGFR